MFPDRQTLVQHAVLLLLFSTFRSLHQVICDSLEKHEKLNWTILTFLTVDEFLCVQNLGEKICKICTKKHFLKMLYNF